MAATDPTGYLSIPPDLIRGVAWKQPCRVATTASITVSTALNAGDTIDGVTLAAGDRVLVKDQSTGSQNGIYIVGATPVRAFDMDQDLSSAVPAEEIAGAFVYVLAGTANAGKVFHATNVGGGTIGTTSIVFTEFAPAGAPTGAAGGDLSGTYPNPTIPHIADATDAHDASAISIADSGGYFTGTDVEGALQEIGAGGISGGAGHILLADGRSTPFDFTDLLQADDGSDFLWSD